MTSLMILLFNLQTFANESVNEGEALLRVQISDKIVSYQLSPKPAFELAMKSTDGKYIKKRLTAKDYKFLFRDMSRVHDKSHDIKNCPRANIVLVTKDSNVLGCIESETPVSDQLKRLSQKLATFIQM